MTTFTIYADKPFHSDYWDDHRFSYELTREELVDVWAECLWANLNCCENEPKYSFIILENGRHLPAGTEPYQILFDEALVWARKLKEEHEAKERARHAEAKAQEEVRRKEQRRKEYEALKKEFEG